MITHQIKAYKRRFTQKCNNPLLKFSAKVYWLDNNNVVFV